MGFTNNGSGLHLLQQTPAGMSVHDSIKDLLVEGSDLEPQTPQLEASHDSTGQVDTLLKPPIYEELEIKSDVEYVCSDIAYRIDALYRLSMLIRNPATPDKTRKAHKYAAIDVTHFEPYERERIVYKYGAKVETDEAGSEADEAEFKTDGAQYEVRLPQFLVDRLVLANLKRRQIFTYAREHQAKKTATSKPKVAIRRLAPPGQAASTAPTSAILSETTATAFQNLGAPELMNIVCTAPVDYEIPQAMNIPTGIVNFQVPKDTLSAPCNTMSEDGASQTSSIAASVVFSEVRDSGGIPMNIPLPLGKEKLFGGKPIYFECPFCFQFLQLKSRKQWRWVQF